MARIYWYVVVDGANWAVKREGGPNLRSFNLQSAAIDHAAGLAKTHNSLSGEPSGVRIQGQGGQFRDERTYGNDPFPPRG